MVEPLAVSIREAARLTGLGKTKAYELAQTPPGRGGWPVVRTGGRVLVPLAALRRWLEEEAALASEGAR
jgi:excisionase family DNA binding protein